MRSRLRGREDGTRGNGWVWGVGECGGRGRFDGQGWPEGRPQGGRPRQWMLVAEGRPGPLEQQKPPPPDANFWWWGLVAGRLPASGLPFRAPAISGHWPGDHRAGHWPADRAGGPGRQLKMLAVQARLLAVRPFLVGSLITRLGHFVLHHSLQRLKMQLVACWPGGGTSC